MPGENLVYETKSLRTEKNMNTKVLIFIIDLSLTLRAVLFYNAPTPFKL